MEQKWSSLDTVLGSLNEDINISIGYNKKILEKLNKNKKTNISLLFKNLFLDKNLTLGLSLILSGFVIFIICSNNLDSKFETFQNQANNEASIMSRGMNINNYKNMWEVNLNGKEK